VDAWSADPSSHRRWRSRLLHPLVAVEGHRWAIEDSFETAKNEFGLDHNESRSWHGWHRHVSMAMLAFATWCPAATSIETYGKDAFYRITEEGIAAKTAFIPRAKR
jgi:hypothetical protein